MIILEIQLRVEGIIYMNLEILNGPIIQRLIRKL